MSFRPVFYENILLYFIFVLQSLVNRSGYLEENTELLRYNKIIFFPYFIIKKEVAVKRSVWLNLLFSVAAVVPLALVAFIGYFLIALLGGFRFYAPLSAVVAAMLGAYIVAAIFDWFEPRTRGIAFASFLGLCLLATGGYEINKAYVNSLAEVREQEVSLEQYQPFHAESKVAVLDAPASYQITDTVPPRLDGATALYPLYSAFVQAVYPEDKYDPYDFDGNPVVCSSTSYAYKRLISGETDIIFTAAPSFAQEKMQSWPGASWC